MIFETHAHYDDESFEEDRQELLESFSANNISHVINIGATLSSVKKTIGLMEQYPFVYGAIGIHPEGAGELTEESFAWLKEQCSREKAVAVGEIGLDYYWKEPDREIQKHWFRRQLQLAKEVQLPVVIHSRDAAKDTIDIMKQEKAGETGGVVHCFSYTKETARIFLDMGFYMGIGGVITFQNAQKLKEALNYIPMDRVLLETDSPYLAPVPYRGKRNTSLNLPYIMEEIAAIKGITKEAVEDATMENAKRLFNIH